MNLLNIKHKFAKSLRHLDRCAGMPEKALPFLFWNIHKCDILAFISSTNDFLIRLIGKD